MGKRELLIIVTFVAIGAVAYQFTAPAATANGEGLSLSSLMNRVRRQVRVNGATASATTRGTLSQMNGVSELHVSTVTDLTVTGESRTDIGYDLVVDASAQDERTAQDIAARATLAEDRVGPSLRVRVAGTRTARPVARLTLRVPSALAVHVEGLPSGTRVRADGLAALHLDAVMGDSSVTHIAGAVTGSHRTGSLQVSDAGGATLTMVSSRGLFEDIRGPVTLIARNGRLEIRDPAGPVDIDATNEETAIDAPLDRVRIAGSGGRVRVTSPAGATSINVRRATVDITLTRPVGLTATSTDAPMHLWLAAPPPPIALDAVAAEGGVVDMSAFGVAAATTDQESRVRHTIGGGTATVALRNQRANIEIGMVK